MKRNITTFLFFMLSIAIWADDVDVEIGGISYRIVNSEYAQVISGAKKYTGEIVIPASIDYDGKTYNVKSIGERAFEECTGLTSITIPNSVTLMGGYVFWCCTNLTSVVIPSSVTGIGEEAFKGCTALSNVYCFADKVPSIESNIFAGNHTGTVTLHVPASAVEAYKAANIAGVDEVVAIADVPMTDWAFSSSTVTIDDVRYYLDETNGLAEWYGYRSNVANENLEIPAVVSYNGKTYVVVSMRDYYYGQSNVKTITLPPTLKRLNEYALAAFSAVKEFNIPASVEYVAQRAFGSPSGQPTVIFNSLTPPEVAGDLTNSSSSYHMKIVVPAVAFKTYNKTDYIEDYCVIASEAEVGTVTVDNVDNGELGYIVVADALPEVRVYSDINRLIVTSGTIDETDWYQIRQMHNLVYLDLTNVTIAEMPYEALVDCWQIETVKLPTTLEAIRGRAFYGTGVRDLILPDGLKEITGGSNFYVCNYLTSISIPDGVTSLPSNCFEGCKNLHEVKLPANLAKMGDYCFGNCDVYSIDIPGTLTVVPYAAFDLNRNLKSITFHEGTQRINGMAFRQSAIKQLVLPASMRYIEDRTFSDCDSLVDLQLNEGLETLHYYVFSNCDKLEDVVLPSSLLFCTYYPFYGCPVKTLEARSLIPPTVRNDIPTYAAGNIELYVPLWSFQEYMTTPGWLEYQDHTQIITDNLPANIVINKDFEFVLRPEDDAANYHPNVRLLYNTESIDDGFGHTKYERGNLTISGRSKLSLNSLSLYMSPYAKYYADFGRFYYNSNYTYDNWRTIYNPTSLVVKGELRAEDQTINIMLLNDAWQFISFPFDVAIGDIVPEDSKSQWIIREYSGVERAAQNFDNTWQNIPADGVLQAGRGYIMKCYNNEASSSAPVNFTVKPIVNSVNRQKMFTIDDVETSLDEFESEFEQNRSWNLIGNPYPSYYDTRFLDTEAPFLIWDSYNGAYVAFSPVDDDYILNPGEAFFVQRPVVNGEILRFRAGGRQTYRNPNDLTVQEVKGREVAERKAQRSVYNITLTCGELSDRTRVVLNPEAEVGYEAGRDAAKMLSSNAELPQIWTFDRKSQYAINETPDANTAITLAVRIAHAGLHTIALAPNSATGSIFLTDLETGVSTDLSTDSYTFTAEAGTLKNRFLISINPGDATAIENITPATAESEGVVYNVNGQRMNGLQKGINIVNGKKVLK